MATKRSRDTKVVLQLNDYHIPFQDKRCVNLAMDAIEVVKPDTLFTGSDLLDFYSISKYDKNPHRKCDIGDELEAGKKLLKEQRELAGEGCTIHYLEGNHEARLRKYLKRTAKELATLPSLDLRELLALSDVGIRFHTYGTLVRVGDVAYTHGSSIRPGGGNTAASHINRTGYSCSIGHSHRLACTAIRNDASGILWGFEGGCLCRTDLDYVLEEQAISTADWQHGLLVHVFKRGHLAAYLPLSLDLVNPIDTLRKFMGGT